MQLPIADYNFPHTSSCPFSGHPSFFETNLIINQNSFMSKQKKNLKSFQKRVYSPKDDVYY
jgi:hypothetical protein